jgi:hypothetical protein
MGKIPKPLGKEEEIAKMEHESAYPEEVHGIFPNGFEQHVLMPGAVSAQDLLNNKTESIEKLKAQSDISGDFRNDLLSSTVDDIIGSFKDGKLVLDSAMDVAQVIPAHHGLTLVKELSYIQYKLDRETKPNLQYEGYITYFLRLYPKVLNHFKQSVRVERDKKS